MAISESIQLGLMGAGSLLVALLACESKLDNDKLTKGITDMFEEQLDLEVKEVDCPKDVKLEEGKEFECTVSVKPKGTVPVVVEITDAQKGNVEMKTKHKVLIPSHIKKELGIDCDEDYGVLKPGKAYDCKKDGTDVVVKGDKDGMVKWEPK